MKSTQTTMFVVVIVFLFTTGPAPGADLVNNGDFEGGGVAVGVSGALDGLADTIPAGGWARHETFSGNIVENSLIAPLADNGPSAPGNTAWRFQRLAPQNASGDWTAINFPLNVNVAASDGLQLSMDVKVDQHTLVAGGFVAPAFEWPVVAQIGYIDTANNAQTWRFGWYVNPPGDGPPAR